MNKQKVLKFLKDEEVVFVSKGFVYVNENKYIPNYLIDILVGVETPKEEVFECNGQDYGTIDQFRDDLLIDGEQARIVIEAVKHNHPNASKEEIAQAACFLYDQVELSEDCSYGHVPDNYRLKFVPSSRPGWGGSGTYEEGKDIIVPRLNK